MTLSKILIIARLYSLFDKFRQKSYTPRVKYRLMGGKKMYKFRLKYLFALLSFIVLMGSISVGVKITSAAAYTTPIEEGNTDGNIYNMALVVQKGDWVYFRNDLNQKLCKMKQDGTNVTVLSNDLPFGINVVGDWIYYNADINKGNVYTCDIYKIKTDGTHRAKLTSNKQSRILKVVGDWIYYTYDGATTIIYKMKTDGSRKTKIYEGLINTVTITSDWIYYNEDGMKGSAALYKIRTDGTHRTMISKSGAGDMNIVGDWIYYKPDTYDPTKKEKLYKMKTDGSDITKISDEIGDNINIYDGWIYYNLDGLNRMQLDGSQHTILSKEYTTNLNISSDWIYYYNNFGQYKMHLDGSDRQYTVKRMPVNISDIDVAILQNTSFSFQDTVRALFNDGTQKDVPVTWGITSVHTSKLGKYKFEGSVADYAKKITLTLNIVDADSTAENLYSGSVVEKDGWIYCIKRKYHIIDNNTVSYIGSLYKRKIDGGDWIKLSDDNPDSITLIDDWIYIDGSQLNPIYKIKTDGSQRTKLNNQRSRIIKIVDGWIYYINYDESYKLYRVRTDGTSNSKVSDKNLMCPAIVNGWIYYEDHGINKMKMDGSSNIKICGEIPSNMEIFGDWIYYDVSESPSVYGVYKIKTDGTQKTKIYGEWQNDLNIVGNWIYCYDPDGSLYKIRTDGSGRTQITTDKIQSMTIIDDWIYYINISDGYKKYKIKTDGTGKQLMW